MSALPAPLFSEPPFFKSRPPFDGRRWVMDRNPFYLLSAVFMLFGCLLLTNSLSWSPIPEYRLLSLVGMLNIYELVTVGLGLYLIARRSIVRDGKMLLLLECFFLVDGAFLNAELFARDVWVGVGLNAAIFILALVKTFAMFTALRLRVMSLRYAMLIVQLVVLFAAPGVLKWVSVHAQGSMALALFGGWWVVGLLVALWAWFERHGHEDATSSSAQLVGNVLMVLPVVSIAAHLGTSHWVYGSAFMAADLAPVVLGLGVWAGAVIRLPAWRARAVMVQLWMPAVALLFCYDAPRLLRVDLFGTDLLARNWILAAACLTYAEAWWVHRRMEFAVVTGLGAAAGGAYLTPTWVWSGMWKAMTGVVDWAWSLVPSTRTQWGVASVAAAFVSLALGAAVSLFKRPETTTLTGESKG